MKTLKNDMNEPRNYCKHVKKLDHLSQNAPQTILIFVSCLTLR